jgi:large subunit ribosomal protein L21
MFAVIKTGGLQYRVAEDDVVRVGKLQGNVGEIVQIKDVMLLGGDKPQLGTPMISGASVAVEVMEQSRGPKVIAFKKRRRKNSRRKRGHRQDFTLVRISEILTGGAAPSKKAKGKPAPKPKAEKPEGEAKKSAPKPKTKAKAPAKKAKAVAKKPAGKGKSKK